MIKELMSKIISSYDELSLQEEQYILLMSKIVAVRKCAAEDFSKDSDEINENLEEKKDLAEKLNDKNTNTENSKLIKDESNCELMRITNDEISTNEVEYSQIKEEMKKISEIMNETNRASLVNNKLMEQFEANRNKLDILVKIRESERKSQFGVVNETLKQVEEARDKVAAEEDEIDRKRRILERLKREALRRGIKLGPGSASEPDIIDIDKHQPKSVTEAKLRAKLEAKKKKNEEKAVEDNSPPVPENLAPANRIPPIPINDEDDLSAAPNSLNNNAARKNKKKVKKAKESIRERREFINQSIREKLAAITARKKRMNEIKTQLLLKPIMEHSKTDISDTEKQVDETIKKAQEHLRMYPSTFSNLTAVREQLEEIRDKGQGLSEETAQLLEFHLQDHENYHSISDSHGNDLLTLPDYNYSIIKEVNEQFKKLMNKAGKINNIETNSSFIEPYNFTSKDNERLKNIEQMLYIQQQLLQTTGKRCCHAEQCDENLVNAIRVKKMVKKLKECLLSAKPEFLQYLSKFIFHLSVSQDNISEIDDILFKLLDNGGDSDDNNGNADNQPSKILSSQAKQFCSSELESEKQNVLERIHFITDGKFDGDAGSEGINFPFF
ncbi:unnamed protein product [Dracunculus medinensis]|uniref:PCM1_C domain-containing protein n=1 Tax=Dracunculus medinensis TaxID=318479 RepID=A0A0N4UE04_DRAME|nr:unnamed protein product [Dracunculus medinensis]